MQNRPLVPFLASLACLAVAAGAATILSSAAPVSGAGPGDPDLAQVELALESDPDSFALLEQASRAAHAAGKIDQALWYATLALKVAPPVAAKDTPKSVGELIARLPTMDPLKGKSAAVLNDYQAALAAAGSALAKKKLVVTAVALLSRVDSGPSADKAQADLAKLFADKKSIDALLESGIDVPVKPKKKRKPAEIAREDRKHETWDNAYEIKGKQYTIKTNMGIEMAEAMSTAMEQMNQFYRTFFRVKERGGETARCTVHVFNDREGFEDYNKDYKDGQPPPEGVRGFFSPGETKVVTYDPRAAHGDPLSSLWSTLFHEASHQFTYLALPGGSADRPTWLNEGTASYFEGARLLANGSVEFNLVPEERLLALKHHFGEGKPTLTEVVTYNAPGSYPGEYYAFGWSLVYFFHNYEDDKSKRPYIEPYKEFLASYKSGGKHDVKERFVEYFVAKPKQAGIGTFEGFEKRWKAWMLELYELSFGPPENADKLIARARKQKGDGAIGAAKESYLWALRLRQDDPVALVELGEILEAQKRPDPALARYRRALEMLRGVADDTAPLPGGEDLNAKDLSDVCAQRIARIDKPIAEALGAADAKLLASAPEAAKAYAEAGLPLFALAFLDEAERLFGLPDAFAGAAAEIAKTSGADPRRWRRVPISPDLEAWSPDDEWSGSDDVLAVTTEGLAFNYVGEVPPKRYRYEAVLDVTGLEPAGLAMLVFGANDKTLQLVGTTGQGMSMVGVLDKGFKSKKALPSVKLDQRNAVKFAVEVRDDDAEFFVNEKSVAKITYKPGELRGKIGLVVQGGTVNVRDVRLRY